MKLLIVDGNSVGYAAAAAHSRLSSGDVPTGAIYGFLTQLRAKMLELPDHVPVVLWDGKSWRYKHYSEYKQRSGKSTQVDNERAVYETQRPHIAQVLHMLGVKQMVAGNMEADDLAARLADKIEKTEGAEAVLMSGDKDWLQLVSPKIDWFDHRQKETVTYLGFSGKTGCANVDTFVEGKCLQGDPSDTIKGVGMLGPKACTAIFEEFDSVKAMIETIRAEQAQDKPPKRPKAWVDFAMNKKGGLEIYKRNQLLMNLRSKRIPEIEGMKVIKGKLDGEKFLDFCHEFAFQQFAKKFDTWITPFAA